MLTLAHRARRDAAVASVALALLLCATACGPRAEVHTGVLPADPPAIQPHAIEGVPVDGQTSTIAGPPRDLVAGITEDDLPLGLTLADLTLGGLAAAALAVAATLGIALGALLRLVFGRRSQPVLATAQPGVVVLQMQQLQQRQLAEPPSHRVVAPPSPVSPVALDLPVASAPPPRQGSLGLPRAGALARTTVSRARAVAGASQAGIAGLGQRLAVWGSKAAPAWQTLSRAVRHAGSEWERRRSPFSEGGAFWLRGTEMLRIGVRDQAERHYWTGFYECDNRGWDVEGAECLRCLAHIAAQRGDLDEALRHFEAAQLLLERARSSARLEQVRREVAQLTSLVPARPGGTAPV